MYWTVKSCLSDLSLKSFVNVVWLNSRLGELTAFGRNNQQTPTNPLSPEVLQGCNIPATLPQVRRIALDRTMLGAPQRPTSVPRHRIRLWRTTLQIMSYYNKVLYGPKARWLTELLRNLLEYHRSSYLPPIIQTANTVRSMLLLSFPSLFLETCRASFSHFRFLGLEVRQCRTGWVYSRRTLYLGHTDSALYLAHQDRTERVTEMPTFTLNLSFGHKCCDAVGGGIRLVRCVS